MNLKKIFFIFIASISLGSSAYEVDNFTDRYSPLADAKIELNKETNRRMELALEKVNSNSKGLCNSKKLTETMHGHLGAVLIGTLESYADETPLIEKHRESKNSIYSARSLMDKVKGSIMTLAGLNSSINLNGHYIGADKLGHFFDQGYDYYRTSKDYISRSDGTKHALKSGIELENGYYGIQSTGIFSYADLAANYDGFLFWSELTEGPNPYFSCEAGVWTQNRKFDWSIYVKSSWDEAINCSMFESDSLKNAVDRQAALLEDRQKKLGNQFKYKCPVSSAECANLVKQYGKNAKMILGPKCLLAKEGTGKEGPYSAQTPAQGVFPDPEQSKKKGGVH